MSTVAFNPESQAAWYAKQHLATDDGIEAVYLSSVDAGEREIRLIEINREISELLDESLEAVEYRIDRGMETEHRLLVLDLTPSQWQRVQNGSLSLPHGWSNEDITLLKQRK